jgi:hypothetical protein
MIHEYASNMDELEEVTCAKIKYIRNLCSTQSLVMATSNLWNFDVFAKIIGAVYTGRPVYNMLSSAPAELSSPLRIIKRISVMRDNCLIFSRKESKGSKVIFKHTLSLLNEITASIEQEHCLIGST